MKTEHPARVSWIVLASFLACDDASEAISGASSDSGSIDSSPLDVQDAKSVDSRQESYDALATIDSLSAPDAKALGMTFANGFPKEPPPGCSSAPCLWQLMVPCLPGPQEACVYEDYPETVVRAMCYSSGYRDATQRIPGQTKYVAYWPDGQICFTIEQVSSSPTLAYRAVDSRGNVVATYTRDDAESDYRNVQCGSQNYRTFGLLCPQVIRPPSLCEEGKCPP